LLCPILAKLKNYFYIKKNRQLEELAALKLLIKLLENLVAYFIHFSNTIYADISGSTFTS
jgi:hypothetical protein